MHPHHASLEQFHHNCIDGRSYLTEPEPQQRSVHGLAAASPENSDVKTYQELTPILPAQRNLFDVAQPYHPLNDHMPAGNASDGACANASVDQGRVTSAESSSADAPFTDNGQPGLEATGPGYISPHSSTSTLSPEMANMQPSTSTAPQNWHMNYNPCWLQEFYHASYRYWTYSNQVNNHLPMAQTNAHPYLANGGGYYGVPNQPEKFNTAQTAPQVEKNPAIQNSEAAKGRTCTNCRTEKTSLWRRGSINEWLCNACALHLKRKNENRPTDRNTGEIRRRKRTKKNLKTV